MINYVEKNQLTISFRTFSSSKNLMPATRTYSPLTPQNPAESLQTNTCRYARYAETHPVQPLKGLREPRTASVSYRASVPAGHGGRGVASSYRASSPYGETLPSEIKGNPSALPQPTPNSQLLTPNWSYTFSAKERDPETGLSYFGSRYYSSDLSVWLSVDPMSDKYPSLSPYTYCADNPVKLVDPNGESISEFDENGSYLRTIKDNRWHNFWHGRTGRIVDGDGKVIQSFKFSDPKNDVADLMNGEINKIYFVQEREINNMLSKAGVFDKENKVANADSRYDYIKQEGVGLGKFDFSYTGIPSQYPEASSDPMNQPSSMLFLVDGVAYNHMNFGNFLFGAAGEGIGLTSFELRMGAHWNSLTNPLSNGYRRQFDSRDDQFSIRMGVRYAKQQGYNNMYYRVIVGPLKNRGFGN